MIKPSDQPFPWTGTHPWDVDVLVIGGGPAGLSAVTRLRWMKTLNPIPLSVALVNSGPLGGLAKLGNSILTGPALAFPAGELVTRLKKDLDDYPAPIINQKVVSVVKTGKLFTTTLEDGIKITSISVIMACGMLDLRNIQAFWQKGVTATFGNRANIIKILKRELTSATKPIILGGPHLIQLQKTILGLNPTTTLLIDGERQDDQPNTTFGSLRSIEHIHAGMVAHITSQGKKISLKTDRIILEFNSLELSRTPLPKGLTVEETGYLAQQDEQGLYVAGDCGGPPFSAVVALGEGAKAGLEAYQYTHEFKYGRTAPLFAYYGDDSLTDSCHDIDDFMLDDTLIPVRLLNDCPSDTHAEVWNNIDGKTSIRTLQSTASNVAIFQEITALLKLRAITFCPQTDQTSPATS